MSWFEIYSAVGTAITLLGFAITIYQLYLTKAEAGMATTAARLAENAANKAVDELRRFEAVVDFTSVISVMQEVRRLQRDRVWAALPERYSEARSLLISARQAAKDLSDAQRTKIQGAIVDFRDMETLIQTANGEFNELPADEMTKRLLENIDEIIDIFHEIRLKRGEV